MIRLWPFGKKLKKLNGTWNQFTYTAVDLELTGLDPKEDEILSIGWIQINNRKIDVSSAQHLLINGQQDASRNVSLHGITHQDLEKGADSSQVLGEFKTIAENSVLVFHHAQLDLQFLNAAWLRLFQTRPQWTVFDTMVFEQKRFHRRQQIAKSDDFRLHGCRQRYGLPSYHQHQAHVDALATAELFLAQAESTSIDSYLPIQELLNLGNP